jgi:hypothetical protein
MPGWGWNVPEAWLQRPSLAYRSAFDLCAALSSCSRGPTAVLTSSRFYARELLRRLEGQILLHFPRDSGSGESETQIALGPEVDWSRVHVALAMAEVRTSEPNTLIWAEPERGTWQAILGDFQQSRPPAILILGTTRLRRLLPEWQDSGYPPALSPFGSTMRIIRALYRAGYAVQDIYGFHRPRSLLWGTLSRIPAVLGRDDLVDRCFAAMRRDYLVRGWQARWAPVWLLAAWSDGSRG